MLELEGIDCHYAKVHVLRGVSLVVNRGEIVSMIGPNAAGKTTTLRVMAGLKQPSAGRIRYLGEDITRLLPFERVRRGLVLVPEGRQIFPKFTVLDNLRMGAYQRPDRGAIDGDLESVYELFPRLRERRAQRGQRDRAHHSRAGKPRAHHHARRAERRHGPRARRPRLSARVGAHLAARDERRPAEDRRGPQAVSRGVTPPWLRCST